MLTDAPSFQGAPEYLISARAAAALPVLRKDFMSIPIRSTRRALWGADCILIIMAGVSTTQAARARARSRTSCGMDVLVEVHDEDELERALTLETRADRHQQPRPRTFEITLEVSERLATLVPADRILVGESGIGSHEDCLRLLRRASAPSSSARA